MADNGTTAGPEAASCTCTPGMCSRGDFRDHQGESPGCMSCADLDPDQPCYAGPTRGEPAAARLAEVKRRYSAAAATPDTSRQIVAASADDVPALVTLAEAVLAIHRQDDGDPAWCAGDAFGWPCKTYRAAALALLGEDGTDDH